MVSDLFQSQRQTVHTHDAGLQQGRRQRHNVHSNKLMTTTDTKSILNRISPLTDKSTIFTN